MQSSLILKQGFDENNCLPRSKFRQMRHKILMNIYSAGESSIPEVNSKNLSNDISRNCKSESHNLNDPDLIVKKLVGSLSNNDLIITQGAGDISNLASLIKSALMDYAND